MYLVDTNVISEARKGPRANPGVREFFGESRANELYVCVQTLGELRRGIEKVRLRGDLAQADKLEGWFDLIVSDYADQILVFDTDSAQVWGRLSAQCGDHVVDRQIAAIALMYGLTIATRNIADFTATRARLMNPFS